MKALSIIFIQLCLFNFIIKYANSTICYENNQCETGYCNKASARDTTKYCGLGVCRCPKDSYPLHNKCLKQKSHNENCMTSAECSWEKDLYCYQQKCQCKTPKYKYENGKCVLKSPKKYGEDCSKKYDQCSEENQVCREGKCQCFYRYSRVGDKCRLLTYNEKCSDSFECKSILHCSGGKCVCRNNEKYFEEILPDGTNQFMCTNKDLIVKNLVVREQHGCGHSLTSQDNTTVYLFKQSCPNDLHCLACIDATGLSRQTCISGKDSPSGANSLFFSIFYIFLAVISMFAIGF